MEKGTVEKTTTVEQEQVISIAPENVRAHIQQGKIFFEEGQYHKAKEEFEAVLKFDTRIWLRKTKEAIANPEASTTTEEGTGEGKPKECVWMRLGMVSYRICTRNMDCVTCEFDQMMQDKMAQQSSPELDTTLEKLDTLPGNKRLCRYALEGIVSFRLCTRGFQCATCEFGQMMEDSIQEKLAKLAVRREAMEKRAKIEAEKEQKAAG
jgi:lipopolysaccharide biosynthesis regulator YciM